MAPTPDDTDTFSIENEPKVDYSALYDESATQEEVIACYQALIDNGMAWQLEGHVGRTAMAFIEDGYCSLGPVGHRDYYGSYVPSRDEVVAGSKGSVEFVAAHQES